MAKLKPVKCRICGELIDRNTEQFVDHSPWFAHQTCYDKREAEKSQEERDFDELIEYCRSLYGRTFDFPKTVRLAKSYHNNMGLTYTGIRRTMEYTYVIRKESLEKGNGSIGIVPYKYDEANRYYYSIWEANHRVQPTILQKYEPKVVEITIPVPQRPKVAKRLFKMLEEDDDK